MIGERVKVVGLAWSLRLGRYLWWYYCN